MIFTNIPRRGDICLGRLSDNKVLFARLDSITALSDIPASAYEINGVVADVRDGEALVVYKQNEAHKFSDRWVYILRDYILDGAEHSGVFSVRQASDSWQANHDYTFTYSASTLADFVSQLNTWFASTEPFITQDWFAEIDTASNVLLNFRYDNSNQVNNNTLKSGLTRNSYFATEIPFNLNLLRKNGFSGTAGAIGNIYKATGAMRNDINASSYNPSNDVTNVKTADPICLPAYLGTSRYNSDHCAFLRSVYGEGEAGWIKYLGSCLPVIPTDWGTMGEKSGFAYTKYLAGMVYNSRTVTGGVLCPAANYCYNTATTTIPQGNWYIPSEDELQHILYDLRYNSEGNDRNIDIINRALYLINGSAINNSLYYWTCNRMNAGLFWSYRGVYGLMGSFDNYGFTVANNVCIPITTIKLT